MTAKRAIELFKRGVITFEKLREIRHKFFDHGDLTQAEEIDKFTDIG